jgi:hypothetical protein
MGCNFVIVVSVTAKMQRQFCEITPDGPIPDRKKPTVVGFRRSSDHRRRYGTTPSSSADGDPDCLV